MATFQHGDFQVKYQLHSDLVAHDTVLIVRESSAIDWQRLLQRWEQKKNSKTNGKLAVIDMPTSASSQNQTSPWMQSFMEGLGFSGATIIGHNAGGLLGLELFQSHPAWVDKIVVVDAQPLQWETKSQNLLDLVKKFEKEFYLIHGAFEKGLSKNGVKEYVKHLPEAELIELKRPSDEDLIAHLQKII